MSTLPLASTLPGAPCQSLDVEVPDPVQDPLPQHGALAVVKGLLRPALALLIYYWVVSIGFQLISHDPHSALSLAYREHASL